MFERINKTNTTGRKMERILDPKAKDFDREFFDRLYSEYKEGTRPLVERMVREVKQKEQAAAGLSMIINIINKMVEFDPYHFRSMSRTTNLDHAMSCVHREYGLNLAQMVEDIDTYKVKEVSDDVYKIATCFDYAKERLDCEANELNYLK